MLTGSTLRTGSAGWANNVKTYDDELKMAALSARNLMSAFHLRLTLQSYPDIALDAVSLATSANWRSL